MYLHWLPIDVRTWTLENGPCFSRNVEAIVRLFPEKAETRRSIALFVIFCVCVRVSNDSGTTTGSRFHSRLTKSKFGLWREFGDAFPVVIPILILGPRL